MTSPTTLPDAAVHGIAVSQQGKAIYVATDGGVYFTAHRRDLAEPSHAMATARGPAAGRGAPMFAWIPARTSCGWQCKGSAFTRLWRRIGGETRGW